MNTYLQRYYLERHVPPAIDVDGLAGDVRRVTEEKMHRLGDVFRRSFALERRMRNDALSRQLVERGIVGPQDRSWRDGIDADLRSELTRQRTGQADQAGLGDA